MFVLIWIACVTEGNFATKAATTLCRRYEECDKGSFEGTYSDQQDCVDETEPPLSDYYACLASECDFNAGNAGACLSGYANESCEDVSQGQLPSACEDVYEGCSDADIAACLLDAAF